MTVYGFPPDMLDSLAPSTYTVERTEHGIDIVQQYETIEQPDTSEPRFYRAAGTKRQRLTLADARSVWEQLGNVLDQEGTLR